MDEPLFPSGWFQRRYNANSRVHYIGVEFKTGAEVLADEQKRERELSRYRRRQAAKAVLRSYTEGANYIDGGGD